MSGAIKPRLWTIPPGVPFLRTLARSLLEGALVPGWKLDGDPLRLADVTIYLPTRRAARELRSVFADLLGGQATILPSIRPLGEFENAADLGEDESAGLPDLPLPVGDLERILALAPLVQAWKRRVPAEVAAMIGGDVTVPASTADAIWLARDLAGLMDEVETEGGDWTKLRELVPEELAAWWQLSVSFLEIVTGHWPTHLQEISRSSPAAWRNAAMRAEAERLRRQGSAGPVIAAGSTGSIPATAELLSAIASLDQGAVVLPGLDQELDGEAWDAIAVPGAPPADFGHPQTQLKRLLMRLGVERADVAVLQHAEPRPRARARLVSEAMRPAETTDIWPNLRPELEVLIAEGALVDVDLAEAVNEREEATAIAIALRLAVEEQGRTAALVTGDRALARRVSAELMRFGVQADDSAGSPLSQSQPASLLSLAVETALKPGDPLALLSLLKHPLLGCALPSGKARRAAEMVELCALRGGTGRPDIAELPHVLENRLGELADDRRPPLWLARMGAGRIDEARRLAAAIASALKPLTALRALQPQPVSFWARASVEAAENLCRSEDGSPERLYEGDAGGDLANLLREMVLTTGGPVISSGEWPEVLAALMAGRSVKPALGADPRIHIWGPLEARLQSVDTLVLGGMNEGSWPRRAEADRFMSRFMKSELSLDPPERRVGQAAHDFCMAMGAPKVILTRAARAGDAPAVASRWLQRLLAVAGEGEAKEMRRRGSRFIAWAEEIDSAERQDFAPRPEPRPPLELRPQRLSITEVETLRRDPYAIYARRILELQPLDPLMRDPAAAERGSLFHDILHRFTSEVPDPSVTDAREQLLEIGRDAFSQAQLPADVHAVWWPRFMRMADEVVQWEGRERAAAIRRFPEARARATEIGATGVFLSGRADRIDVLDSGQADILDYKTGSSPSKGQAFTLLAPQLPLEAALLERGAFAELGKRQAQELAYVRLKANGEVVEESVLRHDRNSKSAQDLGEEAWERLERLVQFFQDPENGYKSRTLPFKERDMNGDYDHLARVLEWSAGADRAEEPGG